LCGRATVGEIEGKILVNGVVCKNIRDVPHQGSPFFSYVMQDDAFNPMLTVRETLTFASMLRLRTCEIYFSSSPYLLIACAANLKDVEEPVNNTLELLGLTKVADMFINIPENRTLSNGQLRRLTIGIEVVNAPALIFLDEPTSGLDSYLAMKVVESLVALASAGHTIICTIHQPSDQVFSKFDKLLLLSGGSSRYFGPAAKAASYFVSLGYDNSKYFNPADFAISVCQDVDKKEMPLSFEQVSHAEIADSSIVNFHATHNRNVTAFEKSVQSLKDNLILMYILLYRETISTYRRKEFITISVVRAAAFGVVVGS
jgi:ABC-type multidrug transport system ATPase subunit